MMERDIIGNDPITPGPALSITRMLQAVIGIFLLVFGYWIGHEHFDLILKGVKTEGIIVGFKEVHIHRNRSGGGGPSKLSSSFFAPIVEFHAGGKLIRFQNWCGDASEAGMGTSVPVLYDARQPEQAMINYRFMNWIPWGPIFFLGVFLSLAALFGRRFPGNSRV